MHAVGLGEVLALRGLIAAIHQQAPDTKFLVTSGTKASGEVFSKQLPANTIHQYAPLDTTPYIEKFIDHWQPQLSVWAEQDIWPALVCACEDHKIPLALVNARMNRASYKKRARLTGLCKALYGKFLYVSAQDEESAGHLDALGAIDVEIGGSIKSAAVALTDQPDQRKLLTDHLATRFIWLLASSHEADETLALKAHKELIETKPDALLIIAPRLPARSTDITAASEAQSLKSICRTTQDIPDQHHNVFIADTFGEMGLWYRLCPVALIGGSFSDVEGHNPWEAAALGCAIVNGPRTANFYNDYQQLKSASAAIEISTAEGLLKALAKADFSNLTSRASQLIEHQSASIETMATKLVGLAKHG